MKELDGYHTFFTHPGTRVPQYWPIDALAQLASALFWKHNFGPIHLSCDKQHLHGLRLYGIESVYDSIDTELMDRIPPVDERYWAFSKIAMAKELAQKGKPFTIIDTDLWLKHVPPTWDPSADLQCFHYEEFDTEYQYNPYPDPSVFLPNDVTGFNWKALPLNCAITYLNSERLVNYWYQLAKHVIDKNVGKEHMGCAREMVFIEQRILSETAASMGLKVNTILPSVFHTQIPVGIPDLPDPWVPALTSSDYLKSVVDTVRHIWGMKKEYDNAEVRRSVAGTIIHDVYEVLGPQAFNPFQRLLADVNIQLLDNK